MTENMLSAPRRDTLSLTLYITSRHGTLGREETSLYDMARHNSIKST